MRRRNASRPRVPDGIAVGDRRHPAKMPSAADGQLRRREITRRVWQQARDFATDSRAGVGSPLFYEN